jgi:hypothetical protein
MSGEWVLGSGKWNSSIDGRFMLDSALDGQPVSSLLTAEDVQHLLQAGSVLHGDATAIFPPEFSFSPETGQPLYRPIGPRALWTAPFGQARIDVEPTGWQGLRQTSSALQIDALRSRREDGDADVTMALPPPGHYEFFSAPFSSRAMSLVAVDPRKGILFLRTPVSARWQALKEWGALLSECSLPPAAWRAEIRSHDNDTTLYLPSDSGLARLTVDALSLQYMLSYIGDAPAIGGAVHFQDSIWAPLRTAATTVSFVAEKKQVPGELPMVITLEVPPGLSGFGQPVAYLRYAIWPCDQGQLCLHKQASGEIVASFIPWSGDAGLVVPGSIKPCFDFGSPYLAKDGGLWQLCFDSAMDRYVYARMGLSQVELVQASLPRFCTGNHNYRFMSRFTSNPWEEPEHGDDSGTHDFLSPLLESLQARIVVGLVLTSSDSFDQILGSSERQRAQLSLDDPDATTRFFSFSVVQPWTVRLFVHDHMLWLYHPELNQIHGWRLA